MKVIKIATLAVLFLLPVMVSAKTVVRGGEIISVTDDQIIENDFYAWGGRVSMSGEVAGDMTTVGGQVAVNGSVKSDLSVIGGNVQIYGPVEDDVRVVGGEVIVAGPVKGDVFVVGGTLTILSTAQVDGDVLFFGGDATIEGAVAGDIQGRIANIRVDSAVGGINLATEKLTLGDKAQVKGDVQYQSITDVVRSPNAVIEGSVIKNSPDITSDESVSLRPFLLMFVILSASGLVLLLLTRKMIIRGFQSTTKHYLDLSYGILFLLGVPLLSVMLMSTGLLTPLGIMLLFAYVATLMLALVFSAIYIGTKALAFGGVRATMRGIEVIFGALIITLTAAVPVVGPLFVVIILCVTLGFLLRKGAGLLK